MAGFATASDPFFWPDWMSDPCLRRSSRAARGLWMDMLALMAASAEKGFLLTTDALPVRHRKAMPMEELHDLTRAPAATVEETRALLDELGHRGVYSVDRRGVIYCRRMVREELRRRASSKGGKIGGRMAVEQGLGIHRSSPVDNSNSEPVDNFAGGFDASSMRDKCEQATLLTPTTTSTISTTPRGTPSPTRFLPKEEEEDTTFPTSVRHARATQKRSQSRSSNGTTNGTGKHDPNSVTIPDQGERINRFASWLSAFVAWTTIAAAMDQTNRDHAYSLAKCQKAARDHGKGWPHHWPKNVT